MHSGGADILHRTQETNEWVWHTPHHCPKNQPNPYGFTWFKCQLLRFRHIQMNRLVMSLKKQWQTPALRPEVTGSNSSFHAFASSCSALHFSELAPLHSDFSLNQQTVSQTHLPSPLMLYRNHSPVSLLICI